jgi:hypothetical protein
MMMQGVFGHFSGNAVNWPKEIFSFSVNQMMSTKTKTGVRE